MGGDLILQQQLLIIIWGVQYNKDIITQQWNSEEEWQMVVVWLIVMSSSSSVSLSLSFVFVGSMLSLVVSCRRYVVVCHWSSWSYLVVIDPCRRWSLLSLFIVVDIVVAVWNRRLRSLSGWLLCHHHHHHRRCCLSSSVSSWLLSFVFVGMSSLIVSRLLLRMSSSSSIVAIMSSLSNAVIIERNKKLIVMYHLSHYCSRPPAAKFAMALLPHHQINSHHPHHPHHCCHHRTE